MNQLPSWRAGVNEQTVQQLVGEQQLQRVAAEGKPQEVSSVVLALARMATGQHPLLSQEFSRRAVQQLLPNKISRWDPQNISNAMWACADLGLLHEQFLAVVLAAAPLWLPQSDARNIAQAASACAGLQLKDERFMALLLQQGQLLLQPSSSTPRGRNTSPKARDNVVANAAMQ